ncbi:hypothetical protein HYU93_03580 [Candidatus Daviesbacteria bacterium]|nr:hypothetical protein [Candidatus Daviesbacteria bacterium]
MLKDKGFAPLIFIIVILLMSGGIIGGSFVIKKYDLVQKFNPSSDFKSQSVPEISTSTSSQVPIIQNVASLKDELNNKNSTTDLTKIYSELKIENKVKECHYYDNCYQDIFTPKIKLELARKYNVATTSAGETDISIGLLKGSSADIPGIGTGYLENKNTLKLQNGGWYWEIGACSTNNRIFIDATSGDSGILHKYVYCGGMP